MSKRKPLSLLLPLFLSAGLSFNAIAGPVCGDGVKEGDEECDNGGDTPDMQCTNNSSQGNGPCTLTFCGDTVVQTPNGDPGTNEDCDDGPSGSATCDTSCAFVTTTTTTTTTTITTTTTTAAPTTTTTAASTTTTAAPTTTTTAATTTTTAAPTTTTSTAPTTTTTGGTTSTTMGTGPTTTTTTTPTTTTTAAATTTTTLVPGEPGDKVEDVPLEGSDDTVTISNDSGESIDNVSTGIAAGGPDDVIFPFGTISYTTTSAPGGSVTMRFEFSSNLPDNLEIYKVDDEGKYTKLPKDLWTKINKRTVDVIVTDGDGLTDQGPVDGSIEDPIAVGGDVSGAYDFGGSSGCTIGNTQSASIDPIWLFLLALPGAGLMRRRLATSKQASNR